VEELGTKMVDDQTPQRQPMDWAIVLEMQVEVMALKEALCFLLATTMLQMKWLCVAEVLQGTETQVGQMVVWVEDQVKGILGVQVAQNPLAKQEVALDAMAVGVALEGARATTRLQLEWKIVVKS